MLYIMHTYTPIYIYIKGQLLSLFVKQAYCIGYSKTKLNVLKTYNVFYLCFHEIFILLNKNEVDILICIGWGKL